MMSIPKLAVWFFCGAFLCVNAAMADVHSRQRAFSPSAPVVMNYELPDEIPVSGSIAVPATIATPVQSGRVVVEVIGSVGLTLVDGENCGYRIDADHQSFEHVFKVLLSADADRYFIVAVTVDGVMGPLSRTYRIDFSQPADAVSSPQPALKFLPSTRTR